MSHLSTFWQFTKTDLECKNVTFGPFSKNNVFDVLGHNQDQTISSENGPLLLENGPRIKTAKTNIFQTTWKRNIFLFNYYSVIHFRDVNRCKQSRAPLKTISFLRFVFLFVIWTICFLICAHPYQNHNSPKLQGNMFIERDCFGR